jgi:hypothetical protein
MSNIPNKSPRILSIVGFSVLTTFFAVGVAWIVILILASTFRSYGDRLITGSEPILIACGAAGFVIGLVISMRVAEPIGQKLEKRFVGRGGRMQIFMGAPMFILVIGWPLLFDRLTHILSDSVAAYVSLGFVAVVLVGSIVIHDRIPEKLLVPIGIAGWLLVVLAAFGLCIYMMRQPI